MGEKLVIGPINKGIRTDRTPFVIDNDSFPTLVNAYQWRGRVKRKRGTSFLGRLSRYFLSTSTSYNPGNTTQVLSAGGSGNLLTGFVLSGLQADASIIPGSVSITDATTAVVYTDPSMDGTLSPGGSINYATGAFTIAPPAADTVTAAFTYYPTLPVMGLEDLTISPTDITENISFDTKYAYKIGNANPYTVHSVSFYKNVPASAPTNYPGYVAKTTWSPITWNGGNYQQFYTVNYQGALWATNGITIPFSPSTIGMQYKPIVSTTVTSGGPPATVTLEITAHGLSVGDFLYVNEVVTTTGINFQTGYVITVTNANNVEVEFPYATIATNGTGGIAQYLTRSADTTKDCIRWYDGDPTTGSTPFIPGSSKGWVNFCPPLSEFAYSISDLPAEKYYLVGARMIFPFKDRLLFIGPVVQTSSANSQIYLPDTVIYSQNGTPYYTSSFTGTPSALIDYTAILVPTNQTATASAFWEDQAGFGGFIQAGVSQKINTVSNNEDVLILGFDTQQVRYIYTGNDIVPFNFFTINSELGSQSTFSTINLDRGVVTVGSRGIVLTSQVDSQRIDLEIPDQIFQFDLTNNGAQRVCAQRDFINEWMYFTYNSNEFPEDFPNQTLQFNYRDNSWAIFNESYTTYGLFTKSTGYTWETIGQVYPTWESWNDPWDSGTSTLLQPEVIAGNQQGFVVVRADGTNESRSLQIKSISSNTITSPNHGLTTGDYIVIEGAIGTISTQINGKIFSVANASTNTFTLNPNIGSGTYLGLGTIKRMYVPMIQTKQFPVAWDIAQKTRLGPQQYLLSTTPNGQITLLIFLSQNASDPYNEGSIVPTALPAPVNNSLVYSTILYTCPESTNLGLTTYTSNLQTPTANQQAQIWHRMNTGLIGDTIQIGFTMSDAQMRDVDFKNQFSEIEIHSIILDVSPSSLLA